MALPVASRPPMIDVSLREGGQCSPVLPGPVKQLKDDPEFPPPGRGGRRRNRSGVLAKFAEMTPSGEADE